MSAERRKKALEKAAKIERVVSDVRAGNDVLCETCHESLIYYGPGSGRHPGVYCATGCTSILLEIVRTK
jgi:hypothetical protein